MVIHLYTQLAASIITMGIMFNCLYTIPLCNFGIAYSHAICIIVKYFGKLLLKTINFVQPNFSPIFYYPGENRNLKSLNVAYPSVFIVGLVHLFLCFAFIVTIQLTLLLGYQV